MKFGRRSPLSLTTDPTSSANTDGPKLLTLSLSKDLGLKRYIHFLTRTGSSASSSSNYHTQTYEEIASMNGTVQGERNERNRMATRKRRGNFYSHQKDEKTRRGREHVFFRTGNPPHSLFFFHSVEVKTAGKVRQERISNRGEKMGTYRDEKRRPELFCTAQSSLPSLVPFRHVPIYLEERLMILESNLGSLFGLLLKSL